jgi:hypothetical protein
MASSGLIILLFMGIVLLVANAAVRRNAPSTGEDGNPRVIYKYLPRDLDTYLRQDENQPSILYKSLFNDENIIR